LGVTGRARRKSTVRAEPVLSEGNRGAENLEDVSVTRKRETLRRLKKRRSRRRVCEAWSATHKGDGARKSFLAFEEGGGKNALRKKRIPT